MKFGPSAQPAPARAGRTQPLPFREAHGSSGDEFPHYAATLRYYHLQRSFLCHTLLDMEMTALTEADFKELNAQRLSVLKTLLTDAQRATELCDRWLGSGHIADYRAWQTQLVHIDAVDEQYQRIRERMRSFA